MIALLYAEFNLTRLFITKKFYFSSQTNDNILLREKIYIPVQGKVKVKIKSSLSLNTKLHAMKTHWGGAIALRILDLGTRSCVAASFPSRFIPSTHCTGGWAGRRTGLDAVEKKKFQAAPRNRTPESLSSNP
jgi:hypothetical protein